jgi:hypothetical protein
MKGVAKFLNKLLYFYICKTVHLEIFSICKQLDDFICVLLYMFQALMPIIRSSTVMQLSVVFNNYVPVVLFIGTLIVD